MNVKHYRIRDNLDIPGRWFLRGPVDEHGVEVDPRMFTVGRPVELDGRLRVPLRSDGSPLDFTFADFDMPVVRRETGELLQRLAPGTCMRMPVEIESHGSGFEILNVTKTVRCVDEGRSKIMYWREGDGRPEKVGQYRMITLLRLSPDLADATPMFRLDGWHIALVVSAAVRGALLEAETTGVAFEEV